MTGNPIYGKEEKNVIKAHKKAYEEAHDTAGCDRVIWDIILPNLLAFYNRNNVPCATAVEGHGGIVKDLKEWTSNNWRNTGTVKETKEMKVNIATIVEQMFRDQVNETLHDLADVEELGQSSQREFQLCNQVIKMVRESLSPEELVAVQAKKSRVAPPSHPPEKQPPPTSMDILGLRLMIRSAS
ncbi:hypothetical protein DXG01_003709 [Tephrocybe rancida]|nr:hypothetical protein DXG01_003709 [Tephrocybe rancida]